MIQGGSKYYYLAGCCIYFAFSMLLVYHVVNKRWPILHSRQIIKRDLSSVLPAWLYSGTSAGSDGPSGSVIDGKILDDLLLAPLLKIADAFDTIVEKLQAYLRRWLPCLRCLPCFSKRVSAKTFIQATVQNPMWVLIYLSLFFYLGSRIFETKFPSLPMVEVLGLQVQQSLIGRLTILFVVLVYLAYDFLRSYNYYGHRRDRLPFKGVTIRAFISTLSFWICGSVYYSRSLKRNIDDVVAAIALFLPVLVFVGIWTIRNWAANDYVFLIDLDITGLRTLNFNDRLRKVGMKSITLFDSKSLWERFKMLLWTSFRKFGKVSSL